MWVKNICASVVAMVTTLIWLQYFKKRDVEDTKVHFYEPLNEKDEEGCQCQYGPNTKGCEKPNCSAKNTHEIINCLQKARKRIDVCVLTISNHEITEALIAAHKRGICVRVIVSNCILLHSKTIKQLQNVGIEVKYQEDSQNCFIHNKFAVVDLILLNGSMNWTEQALIKNWENMVITNDSYSVGLYSDGFEMLWYTI